MEVKELPISIIMDFDCPDASILICKEYNRLLWLVCVLNKLEPSLIREQSALIIKK
jgi:hypothetical protein